MKLTHRRRWEGENNNYRIYRKLDVALDQIKKGSDKLNLSYEKDTSSGWDIYAGSYEFDKKL